MHSPNGFMRNWKNHVKVTGLSCIPIGTFSRMLEFGQSLKEQLKVIVTARRLFAVMAKSQLIMSKVVGAQTVVRRLTLGALETAMKAAMQQRCC